MIYIHAFTGYAKMSIERGGRFLEPSRHRHADGRKRSVGDHFA